MTETSRLKIYGERNTNTNYLSKLVRLNLNAREVPGIVPAALVAAQRQLPGDEWLRDLYFALTHPYNLGWKHSRALPERLGRGPRGGRVGFVTLTKNPYSWLLSLYRRPYHQHAEKAPSLEAFLQRPWRTVARDNVPRTLPNPVELWNLKNASYLCLGEYGALNLKTETLFSEPEAVIETISRRFGVARRSERFIDYERSTKEASKNGLYYRDYYLNERWREELSANAVALINRHIDQPLMARFGYAPL